VRIGSQPDVSSPAGLTVVVTAGVPAGPVTMRLGGELDYTRVKRFREVITAQFDAGATTMIVDLSELTFVDSSGLGALVWAHKIAAGQNVSFCLHAPHPMLQRLLRITGLDTVFLITGTSSG
jgi:anti-sigma B factor antagonist